MYKAGMSMLATLTHDSVEIQTLKSRYHTIFATEADFKCIYKSRMKTFCVLESQAHTAGPRIKALCR